MEVAIKSPYSGQTIQVLQQMTADEIEPLFARGFALYNDKKKWLPVAERVAILQRFNALLEAQAEAIARLAADEGGKPLIDSRVEVARAIQGVKIAIHHIEQLNGTQIPMALNASSLNRMAYTLREPVGLVFAISAFNHPVNLIIHQIIPAIAVGCPVIVRPASATPLSCFKLVALLYEAGLPKEWCSAIFCSSNVAEKFVADTRISFLSFIGSAAVGWHLRSIVAPGVQCALEHGGVAPVIVADDADLTDALPLITKGGFYHAGQVCVSVQRIFIHEKIFADVAVSLTKLAQQLKVGDPLDERTEVGPIIDAKEVTRIDDWVMEAKNKGAKILCGGQILSNQCYAPTVIEKPPLDVRVSQFEVFGPVVCLYAYQNLNNAIQIANSLPYSFQSAIFTKNIDNAMLAIKHLEAKTVLVNDHTAFRVDWMPFAGRKLSGQGIGGIPYTMHEMTHEKMWIIRSTCE